MNVAIGRSVLMATVAVIWTAQGAAMRQTPAAAPRDVMALAWLTGCWSMPRPDGRTEEHWMAPDGGTMIGMSRTVRANRTTEFEFLQIRTVNGQLAYVAKPSGQAEATFPLLKMSDTEVTFENPTHDFPQRIIYRRNADGSVAARVEGTLNGQARGIDYPYKKCSAG